jgi:hypothetical protein
MRMLMILSEGNYLPPINANGHYKSQFGQDYYLEKLNLVKSSGGFFVEIGCNHPMFNSNSYYLEKELGYRGVSIDGIDYSAPFKEIRPNTKFIHTLIDAENKEVDFYQVDSSNGWEDQISSMHKEAVETGRTFTNKLTRQMAVPLKDISEIDKHIDILMVDVEGHELSVLESLNWATQRPDTILIENNGEFFSRKTLEKYLWSKNYKLLARIGTTDDIYVSKFAP